MQNIIDGTIDRKWLTNINVKALEFRVPRQMRVIRLNPGNQIVERQDFPTLRNKFVAKVRASENLHRR